MPLFNAPFPSGAVTMYGGSSAPSGWLLCDGTAVSRTTFAALFAAIGTTFGVGNGTTTFNVPSTAGVFPLGSGGTIGASLGGTGGNSSVTLSTGQLPAHNHGVTDPGHNHTQNSHTHTVTDPGHNHTQNSHTHTVTDPGHNHTQNAHNHGITDNGHSHSGVTTGAIAASGFASGVNLNLNSSSTASATTGITINNATPTNISNTTGITNVAATATNISNTTGITNVAATATNISNTTGITTTNTGSGSSVTITNPYLCFNFIIKT